MYKRNINAMVTGLSVNLLDVLQNKFKPSERSYKVFFGFKPGGRTKDQKHPQIGKYTAGHMSFNPARYIKLKQYPFQNKTADRYSRQVKPFFEPDKLG